MNYYNPNKTVILLIDLLSMIVSFILAFSIRLRKLIRNIGNASLVTMYIWFFVVAGIIYVGIYLIRVKPRLVMQSYKEIWYDVFVQKVIFIAVYMLLFFVFHKTFIISRIVVGVFFIGNVVIDGVGRQIYRSYCVKKSYAKKMVSLSLDNSDNVVGATSEEDYEANDNLRENIVVSNCYILGAKSVGQYGGFETFVMNLLQQHKDNGRIKYHVACKANGQGYMNVDNLPGAYKTNENEFTYCNAHGFLVHIPEWLGSAQALYYDIKALKWICEHIERNHIEQPIVYILASRIGPFEKRYVERIHNAGGLVYQNPDGHEDWRRKWSPLVRRYWKLSEKYAVKYADLVVCDSKNIESYIQEEYAQFQPKTTFIAYGSDIVPSSLKDDDPKYVNWLTEHNLKDGEFYISVGRFVPENNFDIMIREFMKSSTKRDFAIITTENPKYIDELQQKYHFKTDRRIKFVGTVYDADLLKKIRENAYGYFHGHEVGGTNPSLLESLGSTKVNLLFDVGFNREVAEDAAVYWSKNEGSLADSIDKSDAMSAEQRDDMGKRAKRRIIDEYSWEYIGKKYEKIIVGRLKSH